MNWGCWALRSCCRCVVAKVQACDATPCSATLCGVKRPDPVTHVLEDRLHKQAAMMKK